MKKSATAPAKSASKAPVRVPVKAAAKAPEAAPAVRIDPSEVARVAYDLFLKRGGKHGNDRADWLEAERIVRERAARQQR